jgi:isoleucyl-tRNA synthetase
LRKDGVIGSSLEADVTLYADDALVNVLQGLGDELRFVTLTSSASLAPMADKSADAVATELEGLALLAVKSAAEKCPRCWHHRSDVGSNAEHPELCGRCVENVAGEGEERRYA